MGSGQSQQEWELEPGGLIKIPQDVFKHWAVYIGDGDVVHVSSADSAEGFSLVKKERLKDVMGKHKAWINNSWDAKWKPRDPKDIVRDSNVAVGKNVSYDPITKYSWHFTKELCYAIPRSSQEPEWEPEWEPEPEREPEREPEWESELEPEWEPELEPEWESDLEPEPGDLIEISRGIFKHWAVYVGDGDVVHVSAQDRGVSASCSPSVISRNAVVKREQLKIVKGKHKARINNSKDKKWKPSDPKYIVHEANAAVGEEFAYNLFTRNCEHFATWLRYRIAVSSQVTNLMTYLASLVWPSIVYFSYLYGKLSKKF
ncbi:phospholipase A and acyltransferase 5-like [Hemicordylus capensis]|uniref:phospholipase A and acyltransferase 5-like n=1 Tax=Hemicordylus capensis TaxID=884348 RepID=UPI00230306A5|nr:phospholipase A and acyltransferase 5-like [Hemicordylus capensis]